MIKFSDKFNNNKKIHYNNISFLKTIFTIQILYGHILQHFLIPKFGENLFFKNLFNYTSYSFGYLCECFFIISGYFLINKIEKCNFKELVIKNIIRLWPALFFSILVGYILSRFSIAPWYHLNVIPELLFLNNAIIPKIPSITGVAWYINSLFWSSIFYYLLFHLSDNRKFIYINGVIVFVSYSILFSKIHLYSEPIVFYDMFTFCFIRGIAGVGLGMLIYKIRINFIIKNIVQYIFISLLELILIVSIIIYSSIIKIDYSFPILLILFIILFVIFKYRLGFFSNIFNIKIFSIVERYTYTTYIMQWQTFYILDKFVWENEIFGVIKFPILNIVLSIIACFIVGIVSYYIIKSITNKIIT